jgi:hypothetical protein
MCFLFLIIVLAGCHQSSPERMEIGPVPAEVTWNKHIYIVTGESVIKVGKKIGIAKSTFGERDVYQIPGKNSTKEIAVNQIKNIFFKAVLK